MDTANWILVLWLAAIGGVIGSFLNVVVYRLPLGMSVVDPPSHCPQCKMPIRWYNNVPVFGWIFLGGRCRSCRCPIPIRYPAIEALTAVVFGGLAVVEVFSQGANLPPRGAASAAGVAVAGHSALQLYGVYLYHLALLCTLLCAALIEWDGHWPPVRLFVPALIIGLAAPLGCQWLRPVPAWPTVPTWAAGAADGLAGLAMGAIAGAIWEWLAKRRGRRNELAVHGVSGGGCRATAAFACVGAFFGWQAVAAIAATTAVVAVVLLPPRRVWPRLRIPTGALLFAASATWILAWSRLVLLWGSW